MSREPPCSTVCLLGGGRHEPWSHAAQSLGLRRPRHMQGHHCVLCRGFSKAWVPALPCGPCDRGPSQTQDLFDFTPEKSA